MLKTPTHTFGLAQLFRNFALLGDEDVKIEVSLGVYFFYLKLTSLIKLSVTIG